MNRLLLIAVTTAFCQFANSETRDYKLLESATRNQDGLSETRISRLTNLDNILATNFYNNYLTHTSFFQGQKITSTGAVFNITPFYSNPLPSQSCGFEHCYQDLWALSSSSNEKYIYYNYYIGGFTSDSSTILLSYINSASDSNYVFFDLKVLGYDRIRQMVVNNNGTAVAIVEKYIDNGYDRTLGLVKFKPDGTFLVLDSFFGSVDTLTVISINDLDTVFASFGLNGVRNLVAFPDGQQPKFINRISFYAAIIDRISATNIVTAAHPEGMVYIVRPYDGVYDSDFNSVFSVAQFNQQNGKAASFWSASFNNKNQIIWYGFDQVDFKAVIYLGMNPEPLVQTGDILYQGVAGYSFGDVFINDNGVFVFTNFDNSTQTQNVYMGGVIQKKDYSLKIYALNPDGNRYLCLENGEYCQIDNINDQATINLPLGGFVDLEIADVADNTQVVSADYSFDGQSLSIPNSQTFSNGLYLDRIAFTFGQNDKNSQKLILLHVGSQKLNISPVNQSKKPISITVNVVPTSVLGSTNYIFDSPIIQHANEIGIPPQYLKAQIEQESNFQMNSFRYEPNFDKKNIQNKLNNISFQKIFEKLLFLNDKKMGTIAQIHPRSKYTLYPGTVGNEIQDDYEDSFESYTPLYANDIVYKESNEGVKSSENVTLVTAQNWFQRDVNYVNLSTRLNFIAQTILSSSYGPMQLMYMTAYDAGFSDTAFDSQNKIIKTGKDPLELFNPDVNILYGTKILQKSFLRSNALDGLSINEIQTLADFELCLRNAFAGYNGGTSNNFLTREDSRPFAYQLSVMTKSKKYFPKLTFNVFRN